MRWTRNKKKKLSHAQVALLKPQYVFPDPFHLIENSTTQRLHYPPPIRFTISVTSQLSSFWEKYYQILGKPKICTKQWLSPNPIDLFPDTHSVKSETHCYKSFSYKNHHPHLGFVKSIEQTQTTVSMNSCVNWILGAIRKKSF